MQSNGQERRQDPRTAQIKNNLRACRQHVGIPILLDLDIGGAAGLEAPDDGEDEEQFCSAHTLTPVLLNILEDCLKAGVGDTVGESKQEHHNLENKLEIMISIDSSLLTFF